MKATKISKRTIVLCISLILAVVFVGSGMNSTAAAAAQYNWKYAGIEPDGTAQDLAVDFYAARVYERTEGRVKITVYPGMQLGDPVKVSEAIRVGSIETGNVVCYPFIDKRFNIIHLPYLVTDYRQALHLYWSKGWFNTFMKTIFQDRGVKFLGALDIGFRSIGTAKRPIYTPADLKGLKMRHGGTPGDVAFYEACGATGTMVSYGELYTGLQTGVIDGYDQSARSSYVMKFYEVAPYFTLLKKSYGPGCCGINLKLFESLPSDLQKILLEEGENLTQVMFHIVTGAEQVALEEMKARGSKIIQPSEEQMKVFKDLGRKTWKKFEADIGKDNMAKLYEQLKALKIE